MGRESGDGREEEGKLLLACIFVKGSGTWKGREY